MAASVTAGKFGQSSAPGQCVVSVGGAHVYIKKQLCNAKISNLSECKGYRLHIMY